MHLETSWDAFTWEKREARYLTKKFVFTFDQYAEIIGSTPATIQKRAIIAKVDELMALCDRLHADLQNARSTETRIAEALTTIG